EKKEITTETAKTLFRKRPSGRIGFSTRVSTTRNAARKRAASDRRPTTSGSDQAWSRVMERAMSSGTRPALGVAARRKSISRQVALDRTYGRAIKTAAMAAIPNGTLT